MTEKEYAQLKKVDGAKAIDLLEEAIENLDKGTYEAMFNKVSGLLQNKITAIFTEGGAKQINRLNSKMYSKSMKSEFFHMVQ